jgi:exopolysaccharide production protein ExoY
MAVSGWAAAWTPSAGGDDVRSRPDARHVIDVVLAITGLVLLSPLMALIAAAIRAEDGGPVLFVQERLGRDGRTFRCLKFRTMVVDAEAQLALVLAEDADARSDWQARRKLRRDPRETGFGRSLRACGLDELPQLVNVVRGEMSLVGPRPITRAEVGRYGRRYRLYCARRPGLTGLWQVSGRHRLSYRRRVALDSYYARHACLALDLRILAGTAPEMLRRRVG